MQLAALHQGTSTILKSVWTLHIDHNRPLFLIQCFYCLCQVNCALQTSRVFLVKYGQRD